MKSTWKYSILVLVFSFALVFLSGCTQQPVSSSNCDQVSQDKLANCVYVGAVLDQNPYNCYKIPSEQAAVRKACLSDASDYAMKKTLERMLPSDRDMLFGNKPAPPPAQPQYVPPSVLPISPNVSNISPSENETYTLAIQTKQIQLCLTLSGSLHTSCISHIATSTKNISSCNELIVQSDIDLCNAYAQG